MLQGLQEGVMRFRPRRYHCPSKGKWDIANWEEVKWQAMRRLDRYSGWAS